MALTTAPTASTSTGPPGAPSRPRDVHSGRRGAAAVPVLGAPLRTLRRGLPLGQALLLAALPYGGQRMARRNAWSGMSTEAGRARSRREAEQALGLARARQGGPPVR